MGDKAICNKAFGILDLDVVDGSAASGLDGAEALQTEIAVLPFGAPLNIGAHRFDRPGTVGGLDQLRANVDVGDAIANAACQLADIRDQFWITERMYPPIYVWPTADNGTIGSIESTKKRKSSCFRFAEKPSGKPLCFSFATQPMLKEPSAHICPIGACVAKFSDFGAKTKQRFENC
ncbi:hypothetical protein WT98_24615 [Burkholderia territorii]|nr:hypothetical protein WT98_24615 [Burkholderia territorii]